MAPSTPASVVVVVVRPAQPGEAHLGLHGLGPRALVVRQGGHRLGELQKELALYSTGADAFSALGAASSPVLHYETAKTHKNVSN